MTTSDLSALVARLEAADALDAPAEAIGRTVRGAIPQGAPKDALSGAWLGHALHPLVTDVRSARGRARSCWTGSGVATAALPRTGSSSRASWPPARRSRQAGRTGPTRKRATRGCGALVSPRRRERDGDRADGRLLRGAQARRTRAREAVVARRIGRARLRWLVGRAPQLHAWRRSRSARRLTGSDGLFMTPSAGAPPSRPDIAPERA